MIQKRNLLASLNLLETALSWLGPVMPPLASQPFADGVGWIAAASCRAP